MAIPTSANNAPVPSPNEEELARWLEICSVAEWCGLLPPSRASLLDSIGQSVGSDWRTPIPEDISELKCLWYKSSYDALRDEFGFKGAVVVENPKCLRIGRLFFELMCNKLLIEDSS